MKLLCLFVGSHSGPFHRYIYCLILLQWEFFSPVEYLPAFLMLIQYKGMLTGKLSLRALGMHENGLDMDTVFLSWGLKIVSFSKSDELHLCALQQNKAVHTCALDSQDWLQNIAKKCINCESIIHRWTKPGFHYVFLWNPVFVPVYKVWVRIHLLKDICWSPLL